MSATSGPRRASVLQLLAYPRNPYFKGRMQDFRIYSGALDTKAIAEPAH